MRRAGRLTEWPTLLLAAIIYGGWAGLTWYYDRIPTIVVIFAGAWLIAWHGSLQHETIHGHPTRSAALNALIGGWPLSLWLPYRCYRRDHIAHHATDRITDPFDDPESRYLAAGMGAVARIRMAVAQTQQTLLGRLLLGPIDIVVRFLLAEAVRAFRQPLAALRDWLPHLVGVALILAWLSACHIGLGFYLVAILYPGTALTLLRSFAEHRASGSPGHRVAVVERAGLLGFLFLNNNLHAAHHHAPGVAWFRLPTFYRRHREAILDRNGGLLYRGYGEIVRRFWRRSHDMILHPDWQA